MKHTLSLLAVLLLTTLAALHAADALASQRLTDFQRIVNRFLGIIRPTAAVFGLLCGFVAMSAGADLGYGRISNGGRKG